MADSILVEGLWKEYVLGATRRRQETLYDLLSDAISAPLRRLRERGRGSAAAGRERFWALKDVGFAAKPGEVLGVIGKNGAGKSTLLKILSRITDPSRGRLEIRGRLASLLEVGTGFHPELSGRENIYLNGAILGMTRREIARKFDEIAAFAEIDRFLDTPVKRYSSGMYVRLAFAVAAHLEPDVLIVDEVLAVGDASFQKKCLAKMGEVRGAGRTVVFVSHNMSAITSLCQTGLLLDRGAVVARGPVGEVIQRYIQDLVSPADGAVDLRASPVREKDLRPIFRSATIRGASGVVTAHLSSGERVEVELELETEKRIESPRLEVGVNDELGRRIFTVGSFLSSESIDAVDGFARVRCVIDDLPLAPGRYALTFCLGERRSPPFDLLESVLPIEVLPSPYYGPGVALRPELGQVLVRSRWELVR